MSDKENGRRGAFIVFEGIDRSGKSTQATLLADSLDVPTALIRFPDRTTLIGKCLDAYLKQTVELDDRAVHLLFSANRWELQEKIASLLKQGVTVICDRYAYSGTAYTAAKGYELEWCKMADCNLLAPDAIIYLDLSIDKAAERAYYGGERYENRDFQTCVKNIYETDLADGSWHFFAADQPLAKLHADVLAVAKKVIEEVAEFDFLRMYQH